ncbi:P1 family peptidase [Nonomuraea sp. NPDC050310]|uniref:P1 family peptidase n=1 Tax=Nonomuraea sp. NPDC050310 TaxID=3154935 RepID=UPI0033D0F9B4
MRTRRLRDFGHTIGILAPGPHNAITDVPGVLVGQTTVIDEARDVYSGVTAVVPPELPTAAGLFVGNGYGKLVGATQLQELAELETPILLTSTLNTFRVADSLLSWLLDRAPEPLTSVNPVVGEVNNGWLSTGDPRPVTGEHVYAALDGAADGPVEMGNVGGGAGACALGFKAGIGSASRQVALSDCELTVGVLVQANMSGHLRLLGKTFAPAPEQPADEGSCVVVVALDLPCNPRQLERIAARGVFALGQVGAAFSQGSGDYGLAFSTIPDPAPRTLEPADLDRVFAGVLEAVEEAVIDALLAADTVRTSLGRQALALPYELLG